MTVIARVDRLKDGIVRLWHDNFNLSVATYDNMCDAMIMGMDRIVPHPLLALHEHASVSATTNRMRKDDANRSRDACTGITGIANEQQLLWRDDGI